jgi:hypothetical protein
MRSCELGAEFSPFGLAARLPTLIGEAVPDAIVADGGQASPPAASHRL